MRNSDPNNYVPYVWDANNDVFDHVQLAANWDAIDAALAQARNTNKIDNDAALPSGLVAGDRGRIAYLTNDSGGFTAGTVVLWNGAAFRALGPFEVHPTAPSSGNYAGRIVLISGSGDPNFPQWTTIRYDGAAWARIDKGIDTVANLAGTTNNYTGRLVLSTQAETIGGVTYAANSLYRYAGGWALVGPQPAAPGTQKTYRLVQTDVTTTNLVSPGDTLFTFDAAAFENTIHFLEVSIPRLKNSGATNNVNFLLREGGSTVGTINSIQIQANDIYVPTHFLMPFTPTAASHTYSVTWYVSAGTATINTTGLTPAVFRIYKA